MLSDFNRFGSITHYQTWKTNMWCLNLPPDDTFCYLKLSHGNAFVARLNFAYDMRVHSITTVGLLIEL